MSFYWSPTEIFDEVQKDLPLILSDKCMQAGITLRPEFVEDLIVEFLANERRFWSIYTMEFIGYYRIAILSEYAYYR